MSHTMQRIYRAMLPDGNVPMVGNDGRMLGVRTPSDTKIGVEPDVVPDEQGNIRPRTGGMSVAPRLIELPKHRLPHRLRFAGILKAEGSDKMQVWTCGHEAFVEGPLRPGPYLRIDPDNPRHGLVEPDRVMTIAEYRRALEALRDQWIVDEVIR